MKRKKLGTTVYLALVWIIILAALLITASYAWFTFSPSTKVTPLSGTIGEGDGSLLISNQIDGTYDKTCTLTPDSLPDVLSPLSTADLNSFYTAAAQNREGISILFSDISDQADSRIIHGKVYLKCENGGCDVYLYRSGLELGQDAQTLAALRLGLRVSTQSGPQTYILKLDALGNTAAAASRRTVPASGTVIESVDAAGNAAFTEDPSLDISDFFAVEQGTADEQPTAGSRALCTLAAGEIVPVEYWLYLEGCDDNCIGDVQQKDIGLQLSFAGAALD